MSQGGRKKANYTLLKEQGVTDREVDIIRLLVDGSSNATIAAQLFISETTVSEDGLVADTMAYLL